MKYFKNIFITSALFLSSVTHSELVTTNIFSDEVIDFEEFAIDGEISGSFQIGSTIGMDITIESSNPGNPLYIYDGGWGLCDNGNAAGSKYAGLNHSSDTMIIKVNDGFASAIGGVINYAQGCNASPVVISAYDAAGNIIESHELPDFSTPNFTPKGLFFAIDTGENNIASFHISGGEANIIDDIVVSRASAPPTQPQQMISVNNTPKGVLGRTSVLEVAYDTTDNNNQLSGLGMRVHYDSSLISFNEITGLIEQDIIVDGQGPFSDDADFDNDPLTDQYMLFGWASLYNNWPNTELPAVLMNITFDVSENIDTNVISSTNINFTDTSFTAGYEFSAESYQLDILKATWDFDGNGQADALSDGLMMLRYLFGLRGDLVTNSAMSPESPFSSDEIVSEIEAAMDIADIDADGELNALTDGLLLLRYLFGLRDDILTNGAVGPGATRSSNEDIHNYLESHMPNSLPIVPVDLGETAQFTEAFGDAVIGEGDIYEFPTGAQSWAGFANMNTDMYPLSFSEAGSITFNASVLSGGSANIRFVLEYQPYPDIYPAYYADTITVSGSDTASYTVVIPSQGANTFSSMLMYIDERDVAVTITDVKVNSD